MRTITFFVPGLPRPAGSKRAFALRKGGVLTGRVAVTDANPKSRDWKTQVSQVAADKMKEDGRGLLEGPLKLTVDFKLPRPKSHFRTGKHAGQKKDTAPFFHTSKPDATKLTRAVEDALTNIVWHDDAQVSMQHVGKTYESCDIGCWVTIAELVD